jgi:hypothetical protein
MIRIMILVYRYSRKQPDRGKNHRQCNIETETVQKDRDSKIYSIETVQNRVRDRDRDRAQSNTHPVVAVGAAQPFPAVGNASKVGGASVLELMV